MPAFGLHRLRSIYIAVDILCYASYSMCCIVWDEGGVQVEAQMKRGFLEACVLAAVSGDESYGYQIVKDVPASMGLTESTLYPLLKRLEKAGCITARSAEHNGRPRRYYRITDTGRERIEEFLAEWPSVQEIHRYIEEAHHDTR